MAHDEELAGRVRELISGEVAVAERPMFGGLAFLVDGRMAVAVSGRGGLMVRVDPSQVAHLCAQPHTEPFEMRGV
jgi:TfoX/Sxy family transcriptional regulator of competence genes